jgi:hypothetical protein
MLNSNKKFFLPKPYNNKLKSAIAKYGVVNNYDANGNIETYNHDLDIRKIGFTNNFFKTIMSDITLKKVDYRLLIYVFYNLNKDSMEITMNPKIIGRYMSLSRSTISDSIKRLCNSGYIQPITGKGAGRCKYCINIKYFYFGNRIDLLLKIDPNYVKRIY